MDPAEASHVARIILLHGTWGRGMFPEPQPIGSRDDSAGGKRWFEKNSAFRGKLEEQLEALALRYSIRWFSWSGANSVFERDRAASKLAEELQEILKDPTAVPVIVAHSHGGNVALRALSRVDEAGRVKVVALATPFLRVFARDSFDVPVLVRLILWAALSAVVLAVTLLPIALVLDATGGMDKDSFARMFMWGFALAPVAGGFALWWLTATLVNPKSASGDRTRRRSHDIQEATAYPSIGESGPAMLVIRGVDDEASLVLAAGSIGSRLTGMLLTFILPAALTPIALVWALIGDRAETFFLFLFEAAVFGCLLLLFLPGLFKSAFGREFVRTAYVCEIAADSTPDSSARVASVTLSPLASQAGARLRHGIYDHPECAQQVANWIGGAVAVSAHRTDSTKY